MVYWQGFGKLSRFYLDYDDKDADDNNPDTLFGMLMSLMVMKMRRMVVMVTRRVNWEGRELAWLPLMHHRLDSSYNVDWIVVIMIMILKVRLIVAVTFWICYNVLMFPWKKNIEVKRENWEERLDIMPRKLAVDTNDAVNIVETTTDINTLDEEREMNE